MEVASLSKAAKDVAPLARNKDQGSLILSNILISVKDGVATFTTTNLEQHISRKVPIVSGPDGSICVEAQRFAALAAALDPGAQVELTMGEARLGIVSGSAQFRLNALPPTDFPVLPKPKAITTLSLGDEFIRGLEGVRHAVSTSDTQWHLRGIQMRSDGAITATDGSRMARNNFGAFENEFPNTIIPTETVDMILRLAGDNDPTIEMEIGDGKIWVDFGDTALSSKTIDGEFPNIDGVIPPDDMMTITVGVDRKAILDAIARIIIVVEGKDRIVKFSVEGESLTLSNQSHGDQGSETIPCRSTGDFVTGFNSGYLRDALTALEGHEVEIGVVDPLRPMRLRTLDHETIMLGPYRV